jgi:KDO2-lipid IV(A) lauroyltransferase
MAKNKVPYEQRYRGSSKWLAYILARALIATLERLPLRLTYSLGRFLGFLAWKLLKSRREVVRQNLLIINAWIKDTRADHEVLQIPLETQIREVFQRAGANVFSGFAFATMHVEQIEKHVEIHGLDYLREATASKQGVIFLLAHMGPWEALNYFPDLTARHGIDAPFGAVYRPLNNSYLDDWYKGKRASRGSNLFSHKDGLYKPAEFLRNGGLLGIFSDQKLKRGPLVPFFGQKAKTTPLPGILQRRSDCPMLAVSIITMSPMRWRIKIAPVEGLDSLVQHSRESEAIACNQALEISLAESLLDGFWFHERF